MSNINLQQEMQSLDIGRRQQITGVKVYAGQNDKGDSLTYMAGSTSGTVLEVTIPDGTQAMASAILDGLNKRGYRYRPYNSDTTYADPAVEIGDNVTVNGTNGLVMSKDMTHSRLMASDISAPYDEEVDHEFTFEARSSREYKRETKYTRSRLSINAENITAEVARASAAEGELSARISINADDITAKVSKTGGSASSFGWTLTDNSWELFSGSKTVLRATSNGIAVNGQITATSGYIGTETAGFIIGSRSIRNGMESYSDTTNDGVYVGTNGIALGGGKFKVSSSGALTATNATITGGSITIRDANDNIAFQVTSTGALTATTGTFSGNVYAGNIQYGGNYGTMGGGGITPGSIGTTVGTSPLDTTALGGIGGGANFNKMEAGERPALIYGTYGSFTQSCTAPSGHFTVYVDAAESSQTAYWKSKTLLTGASFRVISTVHFTDADDRNLSAISSATVDTSTETVKYLGYT